MSVLCISSLVGSLVLIYSVSTGPQLTFFFEIAGRYLDQVSLLILCTIIDPHLQETAIARSFFMATVSTNGLNLALWPFTPLSPGNLWAWFLVAGALALNSIQSQNGLFPPPPYFSKNNDNESRDHFKEKKLYVTDLMSSMSEELYRLIFLEKGHVYICG